MHDEFFCNAIDEIQGVVDNPSSYGILRSSALLRQLLLDRERLVDVVNRDRHVRLRFKVADGWERAERIAQLTNLQFIGVFDGIHPDGLPNARIRDLTRDQFLNYNVLRVNGRTLTVRDVLLHCAHVDGGVHFGRPRTPEQQILTSIRDSVEIGGFPVNLRQLLPILRIVLDSLRPLYDAIQGIR